MRPPAIADQCRMLLIVVVVEAVAVDECVQSWKELLCSERLDVIAEIVGGIGQETVAHVVLLSGRRFQNRCVHW